LRDGSLAIDWPDFGGRSYVLRRMFGGLYGNDAVSAGLATEVLFDRREQAI